jgi:hypothetical protein
MNSSFDLDSVRIAEAFDSRYAYDTVRLADQCSARRGRIFTQED